MRRQVSNSAVISTGRPARVNTQATPWSRVGPERTFTLSALRLTKRGTGSPLVRPTGPAASAGAASFAPSCAASCAMTGECSEVDSEASDTRPASTAIVIGSFVRPRSLLSRIVSIILRHRAALSRSAIVETRLHRESVHFCVSRTCLLRNGSPGFGASVGPVALTGA